MVWPLVAAGTGLAGRDDEARRILLTNVTGLLAGAINILYTTAYALMGWWPAVAFGLVTTIPFLAGPWLNARGWNRLSPCVVVFGAIANVTLASLVVMGPADGSHYYLLGVGPISLVLIAHRDRFWMFAAVVIALACFVYTEYLAPRDGALIDVPPLVATVDHAATSVIMALLIMVVLSVFYSDLKRAQQRLVEAKEVAERASERMRLDLEAASRVQAALLPSRPPDHERGRFAWVYRPSAELGGDLLSVFRLDERRIGMYVLDVSGHGVQAALLSVAVARSLSPRPDRSSVVIRAGEDGAPDEIVGPADVARLLNRLYPFESSTRQYMTMVYAVLDEVDVTCRYVCAGHPGPIHVRADGRAVSCEAPALPIGVMPDTDYQETTIRLASGERLYFYSDGVVEEVSRGGEQFGPARLEKLVAATRRETLQRSVQNVLDAVITWRGDGRLRDDVSILAAEVLAPAPGAGAAGAPPPVSGSG
jgi:serine phosphatase RsbU (regulator of sigma subunit)